MLRIVLLALLLAACSPPPPPPAAQPHPDPTKEAWYGETADQLTAMARDAETAYRKGEKDRAADAITRARPLMDRLLAAPHPTLEAMEAVSDLDQLYGRMLLANSHAVWARDLFQKNVTRWSTWTPRTPETARRLEAARAAIAECDRQIR